MVEGSRKGRSWKQEKGWKGWKQEKGLVWPRILISLSKTWNENTNETFCPAPTTLTHHWSKHPQVKKIMLPASPSLVLHIKFPTSENQISIPSINEGSLEVSVEVSTSIISFMPLLLPNTNFVKQELKTDHPREWNWGTPSWYVVVTTTAISLVYMLTSLNILYTHQVLEQLWRHFISQKQVFSNPTPIIQSRINLQYNKKQQRLA